jgi:hypothetical protein
MRPVVIEPATLRPDPDERANSLMNLLVKSSSFSIPASRSGGLLSKKERPLLLLLTALAALSLGLGVYQAIHCSIDFQWSGARLVAAGVDPWKTFLGGDPRHEIILGQQPNYLPELYILMLPYGMLGFPEVAPIWAVTNLLLAISSVFLVARMVELSRIESLVCALVFLACTPLRVAIANGQQSILILFFLSASFYCAESSWSGIWLGLSYCKYSFAPVFFLSWLRDRRYAALLASTIPPILGLAAVRYLAGSSLFAVALGPLRVARIAFAGSSGYADLMTIGEVSLRNLGARASFCNTLPEIVALIASAGVAIFVHRRRCTELSRDALLIIATLLLFKHLNYDLVVLLLPFALALRAPKSLYRTAMIFLIVYFWYGSSVVLRLINWPSLPFLVFNFGALAFLGFCILTENSRALGTNRIAVTATRQQVA